MTPAGPEAVTRAASQNSSTRANCGTRGYTVEGYPLLELLDHGLKPVDGVKILDGTREIATGAGVGKQPGVSLAAVVPSAPVDRGQRRRLHIADATTLERCSKYSRWSCARV
ncbi:hypothetical protein [Streptomyces sp. NPDC012746]|uniref:hypothetical protein n=1 Tax=Streptomyces sp. NPDC012746 TaxID=3364845 RepID=UPI0036A7240F